MTLPTITGRLLSFRDRNYVLDHIAMKIIDLPDEITALNMHAWIVSSFGFCGCIDIQEPMDVVVRLLEWAMSPIEYRPQYDVAFQSDGVYYLIAQQLQNLGLLEHGGSIRCPWPTDDGEAVLRAIKEIGLEAISDAHGTAYDGVTYGYPDD